MSQPALADASLLVAAPGGGGAGPINLGQVMIRVIVHHWWKILAIWAVLTAGAGAIIWRNVKPTYESASLLRVEPAGPNLFGTGVEPEAFSHFLETQVELIRSPAVVSSAIASDPRVAGTALLRESRDPESELRGRLQVAILGGTYLIRVGLTTSDPNDGPTIIESVVKAYLVVANTWSNEKNRSQISRLEKYSLELSGKIDEKRDEWIQFAQRGIVDLQSAGAAASAVGAQPATPGGDGSRLPHVVPQRVSADEYRRVRDQLFTLNMQLIETEALLRTREDEIKAQAAGIDPEELLRRRKKDALRRDPDIAALMKTMEQTQQKIELATYRARSRSDPSLVHMQRQLDDMRRDLRALCERKSEELDAAFRTQGVGNESLQQLSAQIGSMRARKRSYEELLPRLKLLNEQEGTDTVKLALVREDLASFREMRASVEKRIEQLRFDSQAEARINEIDPAKASLAPIKDSRRKYMAMTPVGVIALVLGLFLFLEIRSGRVSDLDEVSRRVPVEVYPVPALPGARPGSDQRSSRANEAQLQEFLQSLDHLRVSLWYGKEVVAGSGRCLVVTSAVGGEGKTTLAAHLAVCCAKAGISTLVIDADLRRAALSRMFEEERTVGLSDVLKGDVTPEEAVVELRDGGFHLLPAGSPGQHPGWLFREQRIGQVLGRYRQMFDLVILDTPPLLPVADALSLGRWVDGAIMVIRYDMSRFPLVERARRRLISAGIPVLKTVVNAVKTSRFGSGYNYRYGYGDAYGYSYGSRTAVAVRQESSAAESSTGSVATGAQETSSV
jgi:capsular exopolysaccharide synthesis family protein